MVNGNGNGNDKVSKRVKLGFTEKQYAELEHLAKYYDKPSVNKYLKWVVETALNHYHQSPPAPTRAATGNSNSGTNTNSTNSAVTDDDLLDRPIDVNTSTTLARQEYVVVGDRGYPMHKTKTSKTRMCVVDDEVLSYHLLDLSPRKWRDVTNELTGFERDLFMAWVIGFEWMMPNFLQMLKETEHLPCLSDYERLLQRYHEFKEREQ